MKSRRKYIIIYTTFPNLKTARKMIHALVEKRLIACGNITKVFSIYTWQGKIEEEPEYGALLKTRSSKYQKVEHYIRNNHPYAVPEIVSWSIEKGFAPYLEWIGKETGKGTA